MAVDLYEILGVPRTADDEQIKRAYRQLARKHHPDVAQDKTTAETRFKEINAAYSVLSDPQKRAHYDRFGTADGNGAAGFGDFAAEGFGDIFDMFFGAARAGGTAQRRAGPARGADLRYDLEITLEDAYAGLQRELKFTTLSSCETCKGSGAEPGTLVVPCDQCSGSGVMRQVRQTPLGQFVTQTTCTKCGGDGQMTPSPCRTCNGRGRLEREKTIVVKVPAGVDDGSRIRMSGAGEAGTRGGTPGDLYVYIVVAKHARFRRDGLDLAVDVPISFAQAALGTEIEAPTLDANAPLHIAAGTQTGMTFRLRGSGMPSVRGASRGDLLVTVHVIVPTKLSRRERELLEEFARVGGDRVEDKSFFDRVKDAFRAE